MRRSLWIIATGTVVLLGLLVGLRSARSSRPVSDEAEGAPRVSEPATEPVAAPPARVRYLVVGGGPSPQSTEVSLEQDIQLALEALPGPGRVLFAGGADAPSVRHLAPELREPSLLRRLGDIFQPRAGRGSRYRRPRLQANAASTGAAPGMLKELLRAGSEPLLLFVAAHGEQGQERAGNFIPLWGGASLTVRMLSEHHDLASRPLRAVVAACFSGGFAELAFAGADPKRGVTRAPRCGFFSGTWDRETTGCDPDPDRRRQEGYSLHMLQALRRRDRAGRPLELEQVDFDADGRVSLLEAHTRARIASASFDVPTTTSERYLRSLELTARGGRVDSPEERAVIDQLGAKLGISTAVQAAAHWRGRDVALRKLDERLNAAEELLDARYQELATKLLDRWPILDDPYHPDFAGVLARDGEAITEVLDDSTEGHAYYEAERSVHDLDDAYWDVRVEEARALRLVRAHETLGLVSALSALGGRRWADYQRLLACERGLP